MSGGVHNEALRHLAQLAGLLHQAVFGAGCFGDVVLFPLVGAYTTNIAASGAGCTIGRGGVGFIAVLAFVTADIAGAPMMGIIVLPVVRGPDMAIGFARIGGGTTTNAAAVIGAVMEMSFIPLSSAAQITLGPVCISSELHLPLMAGARSVSFVALVSGRDEGVADGAVSAVLGDGMTKLVRIIILGDAAASEAL